MFWIWRIVTVAFGQEELPILYFFPFLLNALISEAAVLQYIFMILLIKRGLTMLNKVLVTMSKQCSLNSRTVQVITLNHTSDIIKSLKVMSELYSELYKLSKQISHFYSLYMFLCTFQMFITFVACAYMITEPFIRNLPYPHLYGALISIVTGTTIMYLFLIIGISCESVISEVSLNVRNLDI